jgi:indole-3-glycerol phosphate synthase
VQASSRWTEPVGTLGGIVAEAAARANTLESKRAELERLLERGPAGPSLARALRGQHVSLLAEVKRHSPSKGAIAPELDAAAQARAYSAGGAAGISVLTEPTHFGGSVEDLVAIRKGVALPVLKKDFHVAPIQLLEARALGASAALLIARALSPKLLPSLVRYGVQLGIEILVEVRDQAELDRALDAGATMIGVNNRDLETLLIDTGTAERLIPRIPTQVIAIAESGMKSRADVERYAKVGADAVLVGSSLSASANPSMATRALSGVPRCERAG